MISPVSIVSYVSSIGNLVNIDDDPKRKQVKIFCLQNVLVEEESRTSSDELKVCDVVMSPAGDCMLGNRRQLA